MIYTVTFNPAIDYIVRMPEFIAGATNRVNYEQVLGGGKGINVSIVLKNLGIDSTALGFISGFTGKEIIRQLHSFGCKSDFIELPNGFSRINVKIKTNDEETEVNGQGPDIPANAIEELFAKLDKLTAGDTLVLAGSIPKTLPDDIYEKIMARLENRNINIVVDATKNLLLNVLKYHPFLIKPNNHELAEMFNVTLTCNDDIITYAKKLQDMGAKNVLVSMGKDGAILVAEDGSITYSPVPKGKLVNSIGAGDSMVAGFLTGTNSYEKAFYMGVATGSASAFSENLATRSEVEALLKTLNN